MAMIEIRNSRFVNNAIGVSAPANAPVLIDENAFIGNGIAIEIREPTDLHELIAVVEQLRTALEEEGRLYGQLRDQLYRVTAASDVASAKRYLKNVASMLSAAQAAHWAGSKAWPLIERILTWAT